MTIRSNAVTVTDAATELAEGTNDVLIHNNDDTDTLYVGGSNVTTSNGVPVGPGESLSLSPRGEDRCYGIVASGSIDVRVINA